MRKRTALCAFSLAGIALAMLAAGGMRHAERIVWEHATPALVALFAGGLLGLGRTLAVSGLYDTGPPLTTRANLLGAVLCIAPVIASVRPLYALPGHPVFTAAGIACLAWLGWFGWYWAKRMPDGFGLIVIFLIGNCALLTCLTAVM